MALSRFTQIRPVEFNLPVLQFPSELAFQQAVGFQAEKDMYESMAETMPNARTIDEPWRQEYAKYVQDLTANVANAFASGNTEYAMKQLRKAKTEVQSLWKPGGLASALEQAAQAQAGEIARIKEAHADDPTGAGNYAFALKRFQDAQQPLNYDYETGTYNRVPEANLYNYFDIDAGLLELSKAAGVDITEQDLVSGQWIQRVKQAGVSVDRVQSLFEGFISRPEVQAQLEANFYAQTGIDFNDIDVDLTKVNWQNPTPKEAEQLKLVLDTIGKVTSNLTKTKEVYASMDAEDKQRHLKELGLYKGNIDGDFGPLSQEAEQRYLEYLDNKATKDIQRLQTNPKDYFLNEVAAAPYKQMFYSLFGREYSETLKANPYGLLKVRLAYSQRLQENAYQLESMYNQPSYDNALITPSKAEDFIQTWDGIRTDIQAMKDNADSALSRIANNPVVATALGIYPGDPKAASKLAPLIKMYQQAMSDTIPDEDRMAVFTQRYNQAGYTGNPEQAFNMLSAESGNITTWMELSAEQDMRLQHLKQAEVSALSDSNVSQELYDLYKMDATYAEAIPDTWTKEDFYDAVVEASTMTNEELRNHPVYGPIFYIGAPVQNPIKGESRVHVIRNGRIVQVEGDPPKYWMGETNLAKSVYTKAREGMVKEIESSGKLPESLIGYTATSSEKWGIGKFNTDIAEAVKGAPSDFFDLSTNNNTTWTNDAGDKVDVASVSFEGSEIRFGELQGEPVIKVRTKEQGSFNLRIPEAGSNAGDKMRSAITEEWTVAVNNGDLRTASRFASLLWRAGVGVDDYANHAVRANNNNAKDPTKEPVRIGGANLPYAYTTVTERTLPTPVGERRYDIITWNDSSGRPSWGIVYAGDLQGPVSMKEVAPGQTGITFDANKRTIGQAAYSSLIEAETALMNIYLASVVPQEQIFNKLPKNTPEEFRTGRSLQSNLSTSSSFLVEEILE